jgi:hypothetical protein
MHIEQYAPGCHTQYNEHSRRNINLVEVGKVELNFINPNVV